MKNQTATQAPLTHLLQQEARLTKQLYKLAAGNTQHSGFSRQHESQDKANIFLNHGNYLAYGLGGRRRHGCSAFRTVLR